MSSKRTHDEMQATDDFMPNDDILRIVQEIVADPEEESVKFNKYKSRYSTFAHRYPHLFMSVCESNFDMNRLQYMLRMKSAIDQQRLSQHQASVQVGQFMYNKYVKPIVDTSSKDEPKN
jgi:hypothetical protein